MTAFHSMTDYRPLHQPWLLPNVLMSNVVNLVLGQPKAGKSQLVAGFAAALTQGQPLNGCTGLGPEGPHKLLWIGTDAGAKSETKSRLIQYGREVTDNVFMADPEHPSEAGLVYSESGDPEAVNLAWIQTVERARAEHGVSVVVIDHLQGVLGDRGTSADKGVAPFLNNLNRIGGMGITVILIHHVSNKSFGNQEGIPMGHTLIEASARCIVDLRKPRKGAQEVLLRSNLTPEMCLSIRPLDGGPLSVEWFGSAEDRPRTGGEEKRKKRQKVPHDQRRIARAKALPEAPQAVLKNQTTAGKFLETRPDLMGDAKNGRQAVIQLINCNLLDTDMDGRVIAGSAWRTHFAQSPSRAVA